jgi:hypothetical protein
MVTWTEVRREMLRQDQSLGRILPISSLTTTTVVASTYATGGIQPNEIVGQWLYRGNATAAADVIRRCTAFATATGTFTHAGTNYSDTTATSEYLELLRYEPRFYNAAIRDALFNLPVSYTVMLPGSSHRTEYGYSDLLPFELRAPVNVVRVQMRRSPGLIRNRWFNDWYTHQSNGILLPDFWVPSGTVTATKSASTHRRGGSALTDATSSAARQYVQTGDLLVTGTPATNDEDLRGQAVKMFAKIKSDTASDVRIGIADGVGTTYSSYHTGGGDYEELSVSRTLDDDALKLEFIIDRASSAGTFIVEFAEAFKGSTITDALRRDTYELSEIHPGEYDWNQASDTLTLPALGQGNQYIVTLNRPYGVSSALQSMIDALTVDTSAVDLPLSKPIVLAYGAMANLYRMLANEAKDDADKREFARLEAKSMESFQNMAGNHLYRPTERGGLEIVPTGPLAPVPRRR